MKGDDLPNKTAIKGIREEQLKDGNNDAAPCKQSYSKGNSSQVKKIGNTLTLIDNNYLTIKEYQEGILKGNPHPQDEGPKEAQPKRCQVSKTKTGEEFHPNSHLSEDTFKKSKKKTKLSKSNQRNKFKIKSNSTYAKSRITTLTQNSKGHVNFWRQCTRNVLGNVFAEPYKGLLSTIGFISLVLNFLLLTSTPCRAELSEEELTSLQLERAEAAKKWAPLFFLHPDERFFPTAVHSFLKNVVPREVKPAERPPEPPVIISMSRSLDIQALPEGTAGEHTYLIAPIDPECKNCPLPFFLHGTKPSSEYSPPVYAVITSCLPPEKTARNPRHLKPSYRRPPRKRFRFRPRGFPFRRRVSRSNRNVFPTFKDARFDPQPIDNTAAFPNIHEAFGPINYESDEEIGSDSFNALFDDDELLKGSSEASILPPSTTLLPPKRIINLENFREKSTSVDEIAEAVSSSLSTLHLKNFTNEESTDDVTTNVEDAELPLDFKSEDHNKVPSFPTDNQPSLYDLKWAEVTRNSAISKERTAPHHKGPLKNTTKPENMKLKGHRFTVTYWLFYPFSKGKAVCTSRLWILGRVFKPRLRNKCYGEVVTLNSHVGDWEHVSIYFEDGLPQRMYVSTHTYGAFYHYDARENIFVYRGKDTRLGIPLSPKYPPFVKMDGTHPIIYSALGSHGLWGSPGVHRYENLAPLEDVTAPGTPWESWKNIDIIDYRDPEFDRPDRQWLQFHGHWGNPSSGCHKALFGTCDLASGPTGIPLKRTNFPCHLPGHPTFFPNK